MASTQIQTVTVGDGGANAHRIARAGTRLWAIVCGRSGSDMGVNLWYSDNDGGSWTKPTGGDLDATQSNFGVAIDAVQVAGVWELHCAWAALDANTDFALKHADVLSNVASGTPGTVTVNTVDAGGTNAGVFNPSIAITPTGSNPRVWIVAAKITGAGPVIENRLWRGPTTTASPSWTTHNDINGTSHSTGSAAALAAYSGCLVYWPVSAANKLTVIVKNYTTGGGSYDSFTFDPSAGSPALGSATNFASGAFLSTEEQHGPLCCVNANADYLVFGRNRDGSTGTWNFYKTVNGTSWSQPSGWANITGGRFDIATDGTDFWLIQNATFGATATTAQQLQYRKITTSSNTFGGVTNISDQNGNPCWCPRDTGTSNFYIIYRGSTASPFSLRSDFDSIGGASDVTPPGSASFSVLQNSVGQRIDLSATMPPDIDVAQVEIRFLTTGYPLANRSDGTVIVAPTDTSANAVVSFSHTSLTNGTRYYYVVFVKDSSGNWNTGTQGTAVADTPSTLLQRYQAGGIVSVADGITPAGNDPVLEFQLATANFEAGKISHFELIMGDDNATPPTTNINTYTSFAGDGTFQYENPAGSGIFVDVPTSGLATTFFARKLRVSTQEDSASRWFTLRVRQ